MVKHFLFFDQVDSTNTLAARLPAPLKRAGALITARQQTQGRGRGPNSWFSQVGNLYCSTAITVNQEGRPQLLTLFAALAVCDALTQWGIDAAWIKWPNDVLVDGKKIAGILTEASWQGGSGEVVIGTGINLNTQEFPPPLEAQAISLTMLTGTLVEGGLFLQTFYRCLHHVWQDFDAGQSEKLLARLRLKCHTLGMEVVFPDKNKLQSARAVDITSEGGLTVLLPDGGQRILWDTDRHITIETSIV